MENFRKNLKNIYWKMVSCFNKAHVMFCGVTHANIFKALIFKHLHLLNNVLCKSKMYLKRNNMKFHKKVNFVSSRWNPKGVFINTLVGQSTKNWSWKRGASVFFPSVWGICFFFLTFSYFNYEIANIFVLHAVLIFFINFFSIAFVCQKTWNIFMSAPVTYKVCITWWA